MMAREGRRFSPERKTPALKTGLADTLQEYKFAICQLFNYQYNLIIINAQAI